MDEEKQAGETERSGAEQPEQPQEEKKERYISDDAVEKPEVECPSCLWQGMSAELHSKTGLKYDVEFIYCPECGEEVGDYEEDED